MLKINKDPEVKNKYQLSLVDHSDDYNIDLVHDYRNNYLKQVMNNQAKNEVMNDNVNSDNPYIHCFSYRKNSTMTAYNRKCNVWAIQQLTSSWFENSTVRGSTLLNDSGGGSGGKSKKKETVNYTSYIGSDVTLLQDMVIIDCLADNLDYHINLIITSPDLSSFLNKNNDTTTSSPLMSPYIKFLEYVTIIKNSFELHIYTSLSAYINDCMANRDSRCDLFVAIDYDDKQKRIYQHLLLAGMLCLVPKGLLFTASVQIPFNVFSLADNISRQGLCDDVRHFLSDLKQLNEEIRLGTYETKDKQEGKYVPSICIDTQQYLFSDKYLSKDYGGDDYYITTVYRTQRCIDIVQTIKEKRMDTFYSTTVVNISYKHLIPHTWVWILLKYYSYQTGKYLHIV
jgi:hypothetical protein